MTEIPKTKTPEQFNPIPGDLPPLPTDDLTSDVRSGFVEGHVRRYMRPEDSDDGIVRTEIDIPDGRRVVLHKNKQPGMMGIQVPRWNRVVVENEDRQPIGVIELSVDEQSSPTNPSYEMSLAGHVLADKARGDSLDLALAEQLYGEVVAQEVGVDFTGSFGSPGSLYSVVNAMHPGFSEEAVSDYFKKSRSEDGPSLEVSSTQQVSRRKLGGFVSRMLRRHS